MPANDQGAGKWPPEGFMMDGPCHPIWWLFLADVWRTDEFMSFDSSV